MDEEIEDIVGDVKYTDSQKSIATRSSVAYSLDFTDCSSSHDHDLHNSTGKDTYVIECESTDSDKSDSIYPIHMGTMNGNSSSFLENSDGITVMSAQCGPSQVITRCATTSYHTTCTMVAQETYTQTSKTLLEILEAEGGVRKVMDTNTLETQTSVVCITENKTVEYTIELSNTFGQRNEAFVELNENVFENRSHLRPVSGRYSSEPSPPQKPKHTNLTCKRFLHALEDDSLKCKSNESENETFITEDMFKNENESTGEDSDDEVIRIIDDDSISDFVDEQTIRRVNSDSEDSEPFETEDIEQDSLMEEKLNSNNEDVKELHEKISQNDELCMGEGFMDPELWRLGTLTPLTEEASKKASLQDVTVGDANKDHEKKEKKSFRSTGIEVNILNNDDIAKSPFKLPPIQNQSCPNSPHLNMLFEKAKLIKAGTLPSLYEKQSRQDRWEMANKNLASGEGALISDRSVQEPQRRHTLNLQLPPILGEALLPSKEKSLPNETTLPIYAPAVQNKEPPDALQKSISIGEKIKELKMSSRRSLSSRQSGCYSKPGSPSVSPAHSRVGKTPSWHGEAREIADKGCEAICVDLLRRLRSSTWSEVIETLEELPKELDKFWEVITETRIADLLRQVNSHVESPRTQVAKTACGAVAAIIKNTNYTRKPDFYETVTLLLVKTGSYSRAVRRSANLALDHIVCGVEMTHASTALCIHGVSYSRAMRRSANLALDHIVCGVEMTHASTALCIHGVSHKNALVRCAAARLLVVCCALAGGGRALLRARPASAATARRHVLRALSMLLEDKSTDTRKYAERLYTMLRPLSNFEAYYLTDVDVELASRQMKKYDQLLLNDTKESR
ncbi:hypothetical protein NE865_13053 [Phthorimaea operculella]|nr:hypothetical protein NE865_13053 [Phthorimaea operculella]